MGIAYRPEIDGLRAIAVLAVVLYHAGVGGAGFVGVDVFFVISGYLITSLLLREWRTRQSIDLLAFYARRVRRIFPAAAFVVLAVLAASTLLFGPSQQAHTANSAGAALLFVANVFFQFTSGGYFDANSEEMPLLHLWSLSVEEQFYLLWPALLVVVLRYRPAWLVKVIVGLGIASLALSEGLIAQGGDAAFFQMPARFWELAAGGLIAALPTRALPRSTIRAGVLLTLGACILPLGHFPGIGALPAVAGAALIIAAVHGGATDTFLRSRPMVGIGLISYSLYLWHWPLLAFYRATSIDSTLTMRLALCGVAVLLAIATYRYIEQPFRKMRWPSGRTVLGGAAASLALSACAIGLRPDVVAPPDKPTTACYSTSMDTAAIKCVPESDAAIWGDSMAYAWSPAAWEQNPKAAAFTRGGCGPFVDYLPSETEKPAECRAFNALAMHQAKSLDTVYLAARWHVHLGREGATRGLANTLDALSGVRRVVIIGPSPSMRKEVPECIRMKAESQCAITRAEFDAEAQPVLATLRKLAASYPNVEVLDVTGHFCTVTTCPPVLDGVPLYWDAHHVSTTAARRFKLPAP